MLQSIDPNNRFRLRREEARRRHRRRRLTLLGAVLVVACGVTLGARFLPSDGSGVDAAASSTDTTEAKASKPAPPEPRPLPDEIRGVHVTMALASLRGKLNEYTRLREAGLNTIQLDVKDENGEVAFRSSYAPLAQKIDSAKSYYRAKKVVRQIRKEGLYLIGRVVVFEDPELSRKRPKLAIQRRGGGVWTTSSGLGWSNPYDKRVWDYNVDIAESAARAGFDEIMFDYVRFPSDGDVDAAVFPGKVKEKKTVTIARFAEYAKKRLGPLGVRVSAAVFGLSATRDLGIGQRPARLARHLDAVYPMVYPSHYSPGEYNIDDPDGDPGRTVAFSLKDFRRALKGEDAKLVPWLQDFSIQHTYTLAEIEAQVDAARRAKSKGFLLWNAAGLYTPGALAGK